MHGARGVPDISMSAAVSGGALVWSSYSGSGGWQVIGGTSEATPLLAGVVAIADQYAGRRLGLLNPTLYRLAAGGGTGSGIVDVTHGSERRGHPARLSGRAGLRPRDGAGDGERERARARAGYGVRVTASSAMSSS